MIEIAFIIDCLGEENGHSVSNSNRAESLWVMPHSVIRICGTDSIRAFRCFAHKNYERWFEGLCVAFAEN
jgi:hypothetical protein